MSSQTITVQGSSAICVNASESGGAGTLVNSADAKVGVFTPEQTGNYVVSLNSNVDYSGASFPLKQAIIFNTQPLTSNESEKWFAIVDQSQPIVISAQANSNIYVVLLDQVTSGDNTGQAEVTFDAV